MYPKVGWVAVDMKAQGAKASGQGNGEHERNFMDCIKSRKRPNAEVEIGRLATRSDTSGTSLAGWAAMSALTLRPKCSETTRQRTPTSRRNRVNRMNCLKYSCAALILIAAPAALCGDGAAGKPIGRNPVVRVVSISQDGASLTRRVLCWKARWSA